MLSKFSRRLWRIGALGVMIWGVTPDLLLASTNTDRYCGCCKKKLEQGISTTSFTLMTFCEGVPKRKKEVSCEEQCAADPRTSPSCGAVEATGKFAAEKLCGDKAQSTLESLKIFYP